MDLTWADLCAKVLSLMQVTPSKLCTGPCAEVKPLDDFSRDSARKDGHRNQCKSCRAEGMRQWRKNYPEKAKEATRKWRQKHPERVREHNRRFHDSHPEYSVRRHAELRAKKMSQYGDICYLCGEKIQQDDLHIDHVLAKSRGGSDDPSNLRATHEACNLDKWAVFLEDYLTRIETTYLYWQEIAKLDLEPVLALAT